MKSITLETRSAQVTITLDGTSVRAVVSDTSSVSVRDWTRSTPEEARALANAVAAHWQAIAQ